MCVSTQRLQHACVSATSLQPCKCAMHRAGCGRGVAVGNFANAGHMRRLLAGLMQPCLHHTCRVRSLPLSDVAAAALLPPAYRHGSAPGLRALPCGDMRGVRRYLLSLITARVSSLLLGRAPAAGWPRCACRAASSSVMRCIAAPMRDCRSSSSLLRRLAASNCRHGRTAAHMCRRTQAGWVSARGCC